MKSIKRLIQHSLCILLATVLISACDSDKNRVKMLGDGANIMTDENGNYWMIKHSIGAHYEVEYLGDSTLYSR